MKRLPNVCDAIKKVICLLVFFFSLNAVIFAQLQCSCNVPDNGMGTATVPFSCVYVNHQEFFRLNEGFPAGTWLELNGRLSNFNVIIDEPGGTLGGNRQVFTADLEFNIRGVGEQANFRRILTLQVSGITNTAPRRVRGDTTQFFDTELFSLTGSLPAGDPDFAMLEINAGRINGMFSFGYASFTKQADGSFLVNDGFFDIKNELTFKGAVGGPLEGHMGTTTNESRMTAEKNEPEFGITVRSETRFIEDSVAANIMNKTDFEQVEVGQKKEVEFIIQNSCRSKLEIENVTIKDINTGNTTNAFTTAFFLRDNQITLPFEIPAVEAVLLKLTYEPTTPGKDSVQITFLNNDLDEGDFDLFVKGEATKKPERCNAVNLNLSTNPDTDSTYHAWQGINSSAVIQQQNSNPLNIVYKAGSSISLQPNFEVKAGNTFSAIIEPCQFNIVERKNTDREQYHQPIIQKKHSPSLTVFPNPLSGNATIKFSLASPQSIQLALYNFNGQLIETLLPSTFYPSGNNQIEWQPKAVNAGSYFLRLTGKEVAIIKKLILIE